LSSVRLVTGSLDLSAAITEGTVSVQGDPADLGHLVSLLAPVDPHFAIVTPDEIWSLPMACGHRGPMSGLQIASDGE